MGTKVKKKMILGVGIDIIELDNFLRVYNFLKKRKILSLVFFEEELKFQKEIKKLAGIWALKEAVYKTISPFLKREILLNQIKITKNSGKIEVSLKSDFFLPKYRKKFFSRKRIKFFLSLTYSKNLVIALAVAEI